MSQYLTDDPEEIPQSPESRVATSTGRVNLVPIPAPPGNYHANLRHTHIHLLRNAHGLPTVHGICAAEIQPMTTPLPPNLDATSEPSPARPPLRVQASDYDTPRLDSSEQQHSAQTLDHHRNCRYVRVENIAHDMLEHSQSGQAGHHEQPAIPRIVYAVEFLEHVREAISRRDQGIQRSTLSFAQPQTTTRLTRPSYRDTPESPESDDNEIRSPQAVAFLDIARRQGVGTSSNASNTIQPAALELQRSMAYESRREYLPASLMRMISRNLEEPIRAEEVPHPRLQQLAQRLRDQERLYQRSLQPERDQQERRQQEHHQQERREQQRQARGLRQQVAHNSAFESAVRARLALHGPRNRETLIHVTRVIRPSRLGRVARQIQYRLTGPGLTITTAMSFDWRRRRETGNSGIRVAVDHEAVALLGLAGCRAFVRLEVVMAEREGLIQAWEAVSLDEAMGCDTCGLEKT
ncbi:hypothetical protein LTR62_002657 [Meristemomyces frigidus]|uniref:Uncharacterized protein n=1 Tax=Meristemomyces frigidus TaxID=1508187 RepID=A0AAN7YL07_9PEZI|nr:hypothetical protein LTR62_002657 [Meristemomyces frigidus]